MLQEVVCSLRSIPPVTTERARQLAMWATLLPQTRDYRRFVQRDAPAGVNLAPETEQGKIWRDEMMNDPEARLQFLS